MGSDPSMPAKEVYRCRRVGEQIRGSEADTTVTGVQGTALEFYLVNRGCRLSRSFVLERNGQSVLAVKRT